MKSAWLAACLIAVVLSGCNVIPPERTRTLRLDVSISDDHQSMSIKNLGALTLDHLDVYIYTHDHHTYIFRFPPDKTLGPGQTASFLLSNLKDEKTGEAFSRWDQIYRIVVHTEREYWSGGGGRR
ncbi:hypothetical protein HS125_19305 [bacterium]|nr:hypothetical protein [bacterium]